MVYRIRYSCVSYIGNCRELNQDNLSCDGEYLPVERSRAEFRKSGCTTSKSSPLFGVFDGMGGEECGEIASWLAAKRAAELHPGRDVPASLFRFCKEANEEICRYADEHALSATGTTAAILVFGARKITLCNIGDSKIFRLSDGKLKQLSEDHLMPAPYGEKAPLSQNLGIPASELRIEPYVAQGGYAVGDLFLICSDGLTDMVTEKRIRRLSGRGSPEEITQALLQEALHNGGRDNVTVLCCRIEGRSLFEFSS